MDASRIYLCEKMIPNHLPIIFVEMKLILLLLSCIPRVSYAKFDTSIIWWIFNILVFFQEWIAALDLTDIDHLAFNVLDSPLTSVYRFSCWHWFYTFNLDNSHWDHHLDHWQSISHAWRHTRYVYMHVYKHIWFINGVKHYLIGQFNLVF